MEKINCPIGVDEIQINCSTGNELIYKFTIRSETIINIKNVEKF